MLELSLHLDNSYCNGYSRDPTISWELEETHRISFTGPEVESNPHYKETRGLMGVNLLLKWTQALGGFKGEVLAKTPGLYQVPKLKKCCLKNFHRPTDGRTE